MTKLNWLLVVITLLISTLLVPSLATAGTAIGNADAWSEEKERNYRDASAMDVSPNMRNHSRRFESKELSVENEVLDSLPADAKVARKMVAEILADGSKTETDMAKEYELLKAEQTLPSSKREAATTTDDEKETSPSRYRRKRADMTQITDLEDLLKVLLTQSHRADSVGSSHVSRPPPAKAAFLNVAKYQEFKRCLISCTDPTLNDRISTATSEACSTALLNTESGAGVSPSSFCDPRKFLTEIGWAIVQPDGTSCLNSEQIRKDYQEMSVPVVKKTFENSLVLAEILEQRSKAGKKMCQSAMQLFLVKIMATCTSVVRSLEFLDTVDRGDVCKETMDEVSSPDASDLSARSGGLDDNEGSEPKFAPEVSQQQRKKVQWIMRRIFGKDDTRVPTAAAANTPNTGDEEENKA